MIRTTRIITPNFADFDFDTMTPREAWPWFKGSILILVGTVIASFLFWVGMTIAELRSKPRRPIDYQI